MLFRSPPTTIKPGVSLGTVTLRVTNTGSDGTGSSWYDGLYLSRDAVFDDEDLQLGLNQHMGGLGASGWYERTFTVSNFPDVAPGYYVLLAVTDTDGTLTESFETDNAAAANITVHDAVLAQ